MAQAKKKSATRTAKKTTARKCASCKGSKKSGMRYEKYQKGQKSNLIFVICMSVLAATLLFANMLMMVA